VLPGSPPACATAANRRKWYYVYQVFLGWQSFAKKIWRFLDCSSSKVNNEPDCAGWPGTRVDSTIWNMDHRLRIGDGRKDVDESI
jgi:hypothetical protein